MWDPDEFSRCYCYYFLFDPFRVCDDVQYDVSYFSDWSTVKVMTLFCTLRRWVQRLQYLDYQVV
jgi:hypothetical protein